MNAHLKLAVTALCGMLLWLPAAQAQEQSYTKRLHVEIGFSEGDFTPFPRELSLKVGEYYRLEIVNENREIRHVVMAPELAGAAITAVIRTFPQREEMRNASFLTGIDLPPRARVEVYFIPYKEGRYKLFCQDRTHTDAGMDVAINVRP